MSKIVKKQLEMVSLTARDMDGIEMGVLADGTAYLTGRGLAAACGLAPSAINPWANEYEVDSQRPRDVAITRLLAAHKYEGDSPYIKTKHGGQEVNAFPEAVCMAVLEYYAFEAGNAKTEAAQQNFRVLARAGLRAYVYASLGYDPAKQIPDPFRSWHDRVMLNTPPAGMFSCFSETSHIVLTSIRAGLVVDDHTVPDISVGQLWSKYWGDNDLESEFGARSKAPHIYPTDYPQSAVTPEAFVYPIEALGRFRAWLDAEYLPKHYPGYINRKVKLRALPASRAELLIATLVPRKLGTGTDD